MSGKLWALLIATIIASCTWYAIENKVSRVNKTSKSGIIQAVGVCNGAENSINLECAITVSYGGKVEYSAIDGVVSVGQTVYKRCWDDEKKGKLTGASWCNTNWTRRHDSDYPIR